MQLQAVKIANIYLFFNETNSSKYKKGSNIKGRKCESFNLQTSKTTSSKQSKIKKSKFSEGGTVTGNKPIDKKKNCERHCNFIKISVQVTQSHFNFSITFYFTDNFVFFV